MKKHLFLFIALLMPLLASADPVEIDGIWYNLVKKAKQAEVTSGGDYSGSITIPAMVSYEGVNYSVASIGDKAFYWRTSLTAINIPESVTSIGDEAFCWCSSLTAINIPKSVTSIGNYAFEACKSLTTINIPEGVTRIGNHAFSECHSLTAINIPENVMSIGERVFFGCSSLAAINIPENSQLTSIGNYAFYNCSSLNAITIPVGVTSIGEGAIRGCTSLTVINIPEDSQLTNIKLGAFRDCRRLTAINIPESVTSIGNLAFDGCSSLTAVHISDIAAWCNIKFNDSFSNPLYYAHNLYLNGELMTEVALPEGVTSIEDYAFYNCSSLTAIVLPKKIKYIYSQAFANCAELLDVYCYAESVPSTSADAFDGSYPEYITLHVPANALESYKSTAPWSSFGTIVTIEGAVTNIQLSQLSAVLFEGESLLLTATITPDNATDKSIAWSSSNPNVAAVDEEGNVTAIAPGTATITATANDGSGVSASCEVTVKENPYRVVFKVDGEVYHTCFSNDITYPEAPEKEESIFVRWQEVDDDLLTEIDIKNNADAMLYSNAYCTDTSWGDQFVGWHVLFDNDANTFFHSEYSDVESADGLDHYLRVDMGAGKVVKRFTFTYTVRGDERPDYTPTKIVVEGSNIADGEYTEIAVLTDLPREQGAVYESTILTNGNAYRYIRYRVTQTVYDTKVYGHPFFYLAEFGMKIGRVVYEAVYRPSIVTITIGQYGSGTYSSTYALDFSEVEGLKAYAAAGYNSITGAVTLLRVKTTQPEMGLFVKGEPGTYKVPIIETSADNTLNMLVATLEETPVNAYSNDGRYANYKYTILPGNDEPLFHQFEDASTLSAGKAYLQIPVEWLPATEARTIKLRFDDGSTTDIEEMEIQQSGLIFDLTGRRVASPQKGSLYIIDGKKVIY